MAMQGHTKFQAPTQLKNNYNNIAAVLSGIAVEQSGFKS